MIVYVRLELDDSKFEQLREKVNQSMEDLEHTTPQIVFYERDTEAFRINLLHPQILRVTDTKDMEGRIILAGKVYPEGKPFEIAIEP
ncbi:MAG: hypothetical protein ACFFCW_18965 [Candidatus Hodarchaeota archaeon]